MTMTRVRWLLPIATLCVLVVVNVHYQQVWTNELTLWHHAAVAYPNQARVHNNYGVALQATGAHEEAIHQFDRALQTRADFADAYCNRGISLARLGRYSEALSDETRALALDPGDGGCWYNRAVTLFTLGRFEESLQDVGEAKRRGFPLPAGFEDAVRYRLGAMRQ
jgi:tetratricopeptide (TPR) repeat protein